MTEFIGGFKLTGYLRPSVAFLVFFMFLVNAQSGRGDFRGTIHSRYGDGKETNPLTLSGLENKHYLENRLDLDYSRSRLEAGLTVESREPAEFSENFTKVRKGYIQYKADRYLIRAGTLYSLFGRGLTLDLLEDRALDFDNTAHGVQGVLELDRLKVQALAGKANYIDYRHPLVIDHHRLAAASLEYGLREGINLGLDAFHDSFRGRTDHQSPRRVEVDARIPTWLWGGFVELNRNQWELFTEFSSRHTGRNRTPPPSELSQNPVSILDLEYSVQGKGLYVSAGYSDPGYGLSLEYKNYQFNLSNKQSTVGWADLNPAGILPFQYPPTVFKEHLYFLLNRFPLLSDPENEIGFQLEANLKPASPLEVQLVFSVSSKADLMLPNPVDNTFTRERGGFPLLPRLGSAYRPIYDTFAEARWRPSDRLRFYGGAGFRKITDYDLRVKFGKNDFVWTVPLKMQMLWSDRLSTTLDLETQHVRERTFPISILEQHYLNHYLSLTMGWAPHVSVTLSREWTGLDPQKNLHNSWNTVSTSLRFDKRGSLILSYGSQREGMICSNGHCKYVPGFKGLRSEAVLFF